VIANPEASNKAAPNVFRIPSLHCARVWRAKAS
jgi:hypothetical protein